MSEAKGFCKLVGDGWEHVVLTKELTLGRKHKNPGDGFCSVGSSKSISRKHALLTYNKQKRMWEIKCLGKNGIEVQGETYGQDSAPVSLQHHARIDMGDSTFFFLLPRESLAR